MDFPRVEPNLDHRRDGDFVRSLSAVMAADPHLNRPEECPVEAVASVCLVAPALDVFDDPRADVAPMEVALQELGAWQVLIGRATHAQWWKMAHRLDDQYAASMASAAAIFQTVPSVPTSNVYARLNAVERATPMVEPLQGALVALRQRDRDFVRIAKLAADGSARRLVEMYEQAAELHAGDEPLPPSPGLHRSRPRRARRGKRH